MNSLNNIYSHMQRIIVKNKGKINWVNVPTHDGVGAGFGVGQLVFKSATDKFWYVVSASGSVPNVVPYVSQSKLTYWGTQSFFDLNPPYQLVSCSDGNKYDVFLTGSAPSASLTVSQSIDHQSSQPKPYILVQNITDGNYYIVGLTSSLTGSGGLISLYVSQAIISQSWVQSIF